VGEYDLTHGYLLEGDTFTTIDVAGAVASGSWAASV
jgi:hypothetical protein